MVFDFLSLQELIRILNLNFSFAKLFKSGAIPSVFEIKSETDRDNFLNYFSYNNRLNYLQNPAAKLIRLLKRPLAKNVIKSVDFRKV